MPRPAEPKKESRKEQACHCPANSHGMHCRTSPQLSQNTMDHCVSGGLSKPDQAWGQGQEQRSSEEHASSHADVCAIAMAHVFKMQPVIVVFSYLWRGCWGRRGETGREQRRGGWRGRQLGRCNHRCLQATSWSAMRQTVPCPESCTGLLMEQRPVRLF